MQTSRFQLGLMAVLAMGLGFSLASSEAVGYPAGTAVSLGANPSWSATGEFDGVGEAVIVTAPASQDALVTDLYFSTNHSSREVVLVLGDGTVWGRYRLRSGVGGDLQRSLTAGIRVPAGETLSVQWDSSYRMTYNVNGYFAQP